MKRLPGLIFVVDPHRERIAVTEANKLEIPLVGTGDTNVDPDELTFVIPGQRRRDPGDPPALLARRRGGDRGRPRAGRPGSDRARARDDRGGRAGDRGGRAVRRARRGACRRRGPDLRARRRRGRPAAGRAEPRPRSSSRPRPKRRRTRSPPSSLARRASARRTTTTPGRRSRSSPARGLGSPSSGSAHPGASRDLPTTEQEHRTHMADISAQAVKELRELTGAGFMDCKRALEETGGDSREGGRPAARAGPGRSRQEEPTATPARA